jgi:hypothetical protein
VKKAALIVVFLVAVIALYLMFSDFLKIDSCLDSGGKWNYETKMCQN